MKMILQSLFFSTLLFLITAVGYAQTDSTKVVSTTKKFPYKQQVLPFSLIVAGTAMNYKPIKEAVHEITPMTDVQIDDYIQYAPIGIMYISDIPGVQHQNSAFDQTKYLLFSELLTAGIVHGIKNTFPVERPDGSNMHSFPSGHTSQAFCCATVLYHEYKDTNPMIAYSGYLFATSTGLLRMTNNKHWISDVTAGAGIGILCTNIVYYFKPLRNFQPFKKKDIAFYPKFGAQSVGATLIF